MIEYRCLQINDSTTMNTWGTLLWPPREAASRPVATRAPTATKPAPVSRPLPLPYIPAYAAPSSPLVYLVFVCSDHLFEFFATCCQTDLTRKGANLPRVS